MFVLEVQYLLSRCFASVFGDQSEPEWPPHPARLFCALAASYFENGSDPGERTALEWLERCPPPMIHAGEPGHAVPFTAFVPTNYPGDTIPVLRGKQPRSFPGQGPSDAVVCFVWPDASPDPDVLFALEALSIRTACLGRACSLVQVRIAAAASIPTWIPDPEGLTYLRVPAPGRLAELHWLFENNRRPSAGALVAYRNLKGPTARMPETEFSQMAVLRRRGGAGLTSESTLTVTQAVRDALMSLAGETGDIPPLLHGHQAATHCAIVALPFVGGKFADGHLLGVALVIPRSATPADRRTLFSLCGKLAANGLFIPDAGRWDLELVDSMPSQDNLRSATWTRPSLFWETVTPVLLDRFPKKKGPGVQEIIAAGCRRIGLPDPVEIDHSPYSSFPGVPPVPGFRLMRYSDDRPRWGVHARLKFAQPVRGPVILGAGRYFGLGLLRPRG